MNHNQKHLLYIIVALACAFTGSVTMCIFYCLRRCRKRRAMKQIQVVNTATLPPNIYAVPQPMAQGRISSQDDMYAVPLELLPATFNFNAPGVIHKGDHVLVKDLSLIESRNKDEYQPQAPYNPNF